MKIYTDFAKRFSSDFSGFVCARALSAGRFIWVYWLGLRQGVSGWWKGSRVRQIREAD